MKKGFVLAAVISLFLNFGLPVTYADVFDCSSSATATILPYTKNDMAQCKDLITSFEGDDQAEFMKRGCKNDLLACGIKTGNIHFVMIPYFISYITNFLLALSGLICVLFIVIGGYRYVVGGLTDEKEKGKGTIKDALLGMGIALLSWTVVNVLINAVTG